VLDWPRESHLPCRMELGAGEKSDAMIALPGTRVPADERFFGNRGISTQADAGA